MAAVHPRLREFVQVDPGFAELVMRVRTEAYGTPGALDVKTKLLIAMALDMFAGKEDGAEGLARLACEHGATAAEIAEVAKICYAVGGFQKLVAAARPLGAAGVQAEG